MVRKFLYLLALSVCRKTAKDSDLSRWAKSLLAKLKPRRAIVAVARKLAVVMHRMWITGADYKPQIAAAA